MAASLVWAPAPSCIVKPKSPSSFRVQSLPSKKFQNARIGFSNNTNKAENSNATSIRKINLVWTSESTRLMTPILPRRLLLPLAKPDNSDDQSPSDDDPARKKETPLGEGKPTGERMTSPPIPVETKRDQATTEETQGSSSDSRALNMNDVGTKQSQQPELMQILQTLAGIVEKQQNMKTQPVLKNGLTEFVSLVKPFDGSSIDHLDAEKWIQEMEKAFGALDVSEVQKVPFASFLLQGAANDWWQAEKRLLGACMGWDQFKESFYKQYFPSSIRQKMQYEYYSLRRDGLSIDEYERELNRLIKFVPLALQTDEEARIQRFLFGLDAQLQHEVRAFELNSYSAVVNKTKLLDQGHEMIKTEKASHIGEKRPKKVSGSSKRRFGGPNFDQGPVGQNMQNSGSSRAQNYQKTGDRCWRCNGAHESKDCRWLNGACFNCGHKGHKVADCPSVRNPAVVTCYNCSKKGHKAVNCSEAKRNSLSDQASQPIFGEHNTSMGPTKGESYKPQPQGRVFAMTNQDAQVSNAVVTDLENYDVVYIEDLEDDFY